MTKRKAPPIRDADEARVQAMAARDPDNPELTDHKAAQARLASEGLPAELFANLARRGRPKSKTSRMLISLRLPPAVVEGYSETGPGWQVRMGEVLSERLSAKAEAGGLVAGSRVKVSPAAAGGPFRGGLREASSCHFKTTRLDGGSVRETIGEGPGPKPKTA